jgi:acyl-CoA synthetase (AMP-forming)/AMP-acid ligase II
MSAQAIELLARLRRHAADRPRALAVREVATGRTLTYAELSAAADDLAAVLRLTLPDRSIVLLRCPNNASFDVAFFAVLAAGMTVFPVPPDVAPLEFDALAQRIGAAAVLSAELRLDVLVSPREAEWAESSLLLQSSGTTGLPKIVRRTARSLDACAANMAAAIAVMPDDRFLSCVPLCHSYGIEHGLLAPIYAGATVHLAAGFDLAVVRRELARSRITAFPAVPSIYEMLGNLPEGGERFESLRVAYSAGGPLPATVFDKVRAAYGIPVAQLYGATELGSITFTLPTDPAFDLASVGRPMAGVEFRTDADGQLLARAPSMLAEYVGDPSPLTPDGFFPTGDLGRVGPDGNLVIDGRLKFLIDVGGLKVNPAEVERAITQHPAVAACVVVPMRLSETVWRLKAIITPTDLKRPPAADELRRFARQRLTSYKVPRVFELRDSLPRTATGKILRHLLVESPS